MSENPPPDLGPLEPDPTAAEKAAALPEGVLPELPEGVLPDTDFGAPEPVPADLGPLEPESTPSTLPGLAAWLIQQSKLSPATAAQAIDYAQRTGFDPGFVAGSLPEMKAESDLARMADMLAKAPGVASYAIQSEAHASVVKADMANLSGLEWALTGKWEMYETPEDVRGPAGEIVIHKGSPAMRLVTPPFWVKAFQAGLEEQKTIALQTKAGTVGLAPGEEAVLRAREQAPESTFGAENVASRLLAKTAKMLPGLGVLAAGTTGGALAGSEVPIVGNIAGAKVGAAVAMFAESYGPLYRRLAQLQTPEGAPLLDDTEARSIAAAGAAPRSSPADTRTSSTSGSRAGRRRTSNPSSPG